MTNQTEQIKGEVLKEKGRAIVKETIEAIIFDLEDGTLGGHDKHKGFWCISQKDWEKFKKKYGVEK